MSNCLYTVSKLVLTEPGKKAIYLISLRRKVKFQEFTKWPAVMWQIPTEYGI